MSATPGVAASHRLGRVVAGGILVAVVAAVVPITLATPAFAARQRTVSINDASIVEGDSGSRSMTFKVSWSGPRGNGTVSVSYATANVTATSGSDYTAKSGTLTLPNNGCRCQTVSVQILGDSMFEDTETFMVNLSNPANATIADGQGVGTIYDNEGPPSFVVSDASDDETAGHLTFTVVLTSSPGGQSTVDYATFAGTATAGTDYTSTSGTLTFNNGTTSKNVSVTIADDALSEGDEAFTLVLSNGSVTITDDTGIGTIVDDDPEPDVSISDASAAENGGPLSFTISLSTASGQEVDVDYATTDGSAAAPDDYTATSGTAVIPAGQTIVQVDVPLADDTTHESDETLTLDLTAPYNASILDDQGVATITNDDAVPEASIGDVTVAEGDAGIIAASFDVTVDRPSDTTITVDWSTADGTATVVSDYVLGGGTVSFAPGETAKQVSVDVIGDTVKEADETFTVTLSNPFGATIRPGTGTGTIANDDPAVTALTLKVHKGHTKLSAKGVLEAAAPGVQVSVSLEKKKGTTWVLLSTRVVNVGTVGDLDNDGTPDAAYRTSFKRPAKGTYLVRSVFAGTAELLASSKAVTVKL